MNQTEYLLTCLAEEGVETAHRVSKALRFGLEEVQPGQVATNAERLVGEIVDFLAMVDMLEQEGIIELPRDQEALRRKQDKVRKFMAYSQERGTLTV